MKVCTFRERFCELFDENRLTNVDLAKDLHVSNQTISAWRIGTRSPKEPMVIAIASRFNVSVEWLMGFDVPRTRLTCADADMQRIRIALNKMNKDQLMQAANVLKAVFPDLFED